MTLHASCAMPDDLPTAFVEIDSDPSDNESEVSRPNGLPTLPTGFWDARPSLGALRDWARCRRVAPDALLGNALARSPIVTRMSAAAYTLGRRDDPTHLGLYVAIVSPSGGGKTRAARASRRLFGELAEDARWDVPLGSGEGMAEAFISEIEIPPPPDAPAKAKANRERMQTKSRIHFTVDEGASLTKLLSRESATLGPTLRAAFTGEPLGNANADHSRNRRVENYTVSLSINLTPGIATDIAAHAETGLPQRVLWFSGRDPEAPRFPKSCDRPNLLDLSATIDFADAILAKIDERHWLIQRGTIEVPPMDEHLTLLRCRVAAILCAWEDRDRVAHADWELAGTVIETSCRVRDMALEQARERAAEERTRRAVEKAEAGQIMKLRCGRAEDDCQRVAAVLGRRVHRLGEAKVRDLQQCVKSTDRHLFHEALVLAEQATWISEHDGVFVPGASRPAQ